MVEFVRTALLVLAVYSALGLLFTVVFHLRGLHPLDAGSHGTGIGFRLLITPGVIALWPLLALRWWRTIKGGSFLGGQDAPVSARRLRTTHALAWKALAVLVPVIVAAALWWRPKEAPASSFPTPNKLEEPHRKPSRPPSAAGDGLKSFRQRDGLEVGASNLELS